MQIVVVSDTHGRNEVFQELRNRHPLASAFLHCGDSETDEYNLDGFVSVQGNNDYYTAYPSELVLDLKEVRIYMTHGQYLRHHNREETLINRAKDHQCGIVLTGHTHVYEVIRKNGILLVNPGSLYHNRDMTPPSYALITIDKGKIKVQRYNYPR
jgi:putative phosphoesterase